MNTQPISKLNIAISVLAILLFTCFVVQAAPPDEPLTGDEWAEGYGLAFSVITSDEDTDGGFDYYHDGTDDNPFVKFLDEMKTYGFTGVKIGITKWARLPLVYNEENQRWEQDPLDIAKLSPYGKEIRNIRGNEMTMIFQEPMMSLTPVYTIGNQIMEAVLLHQNVDKARAREIAIDSLRHVNISSPEERVDQYPVQLSGGMRQRVMIAMALSCNPAILIADEPTTALDVTIEAQILQLLKDLQKDYGMSIIFITHDLGVIGEIADEVIVMYVGKVVESGKTAELFDNPLHPYTKALFQSRPEIGKEGRATSIRGSVPNPYLLPEGCIFEPRCDYAMDICRKKVPTLYDLDGHCVNCWKFP